MTVDQLLYFLLGLAGGFTIGGLYVLGRIKQLIHLINRKTEK